jgi:6-pyruvoyltetrahydropterin/6-carboxytetrahydropterin synthase
VTYTIAKSFEFSASHQLDGLGDRHKCARPHGHNYVVNIELVSDRLNDTGMIVDYGRLDIIGDYIRDVLDHYHLNDVVGFNPTAEHLAKFLHAEASRMMRPVTDAQVAAVRVRETDRTVAEYRP